MEKRNLFFGLIIVGIISLGLLSAQSIFWYRISPQGRTWTEHKGYSNEVTFTRVRGDFPKTIVTSNNPDEEDCGCSAN